MLSLKGLRVLNTRPHGQNASLSQAIRDAGGVSIECPAILITPIDRDWEAQLGNLHHIDQAIFTSTNAVQYFFDKLLMAWPHDIRVTAIGNATAAALQQRGIQVSDVPLSSCSENVLKLEAMQCVKQQTIVIVKGEKGRTLLADTLIRRGALVLSIDVYRRVLPVIPHAFIESLWRRDAVDAIVFTSEEGMNNVFTLFGKDAHAWLQNKPCIVNSERLAKAAALLGLKTIIVNTNDNLGIK